MGLIGSALGAAASIFGGISASKAMKKVKKNIEQQQAENTDWYNRRYNEDATQRADAQRMIQMTNDAIKNRNRAAAATQAVMGGTDESVAAAKQANAEAMADTAAQIAAQGAARQDRIEDQYHTQRNSLNQQLNNLEVQKANAIGQAAQGVASSVGNKNFGSTKLFGKDVAL